MKTLKTVLGLAKEFLERQGVERSRLVAESLLAHYLKMERIDLYMNFDRPLLEEELVPFREGLKRAKSKEPFEYITGSLDFFDCSLKVDPRVLIPRQETEILLDLVCKGFNGEGVALDLCTGSGCLAIGLKKKFPGLEVVAADLSEDALELAKVNGEANGVEIEWIKSDLTRQLQGRVFDLVICNPPYISESEFAALDSGVKDFEPKLALVSGPTGFEVYDRLVEELPPIMRPGGQVFFEMGSSQGAGMKDRFSHGSWREMEVLPDWSGLDRFFFLKM